MHQIDVAARENNSHAFPFDVDYMLGDPAYGTAADGSITIFIVSQSCASQNDRFLPYGHELSSTYAE